MKRHHLDLLLYAVAAIAIAAVGGSMLAAGANGLSGVTLAVHVAAKWLLLAAGAYLSMRNARAMGGASVPIGRAWMLFAMGIWFFFLAELGEAYYQFVLHNLNPFPSVLDAFYIQAYPALLLGLIGFVRAYAAAGYPMGSTRDTVIITVVLTALGLAALWPVLRADSGEFGPLVKLLAMAYPLLDIALLVAVGLLLRGARQFGGGHAWEVWAFIMAGMVVMVAGDFVYAYASLNAEDVVDPISEMLFVASYALLARGALRQLDLIEA
jgi:hypothetical protein